MLVRMAIRRLVMILLVKGLLFTEVLLGTYAYYCFQRKKEDCSVTQQLGVTCLAGYAVGSIGSIISNPADNIVASFNNRKAGVEWLMKNQSTYQNPFIQLLGGEDEEDGGECGENGGKNDSDNGGKNGGYQW
ncbi:mitochondrial phosphate carrier protein 1, mitochondrial-like protein [Tanacetum coccineum]